MVVTVAPMKDVRYMGGINGRIPRICQVVKGEGCGVDESAVTTILLNPSAEGVDGCILIQLACFSPCVWRGKGVM
eukprot:1951903-Ditylum_brightwellii.AAC.1